ncbi:MAG: bifunctional diaminohydroxyphosphoribosylaminopyrimidine deaminase/5-amino-6-(5-phosphoribosylamino)uracil reductase RibD [Deltaproteobacteria bacterium]|nr:MAG: bifunctional diaminohydroxyphosphoribosylaminopyrimidine deaminase/5-amino-6-(5-phosphoribosylamino)uracil reductase RibD [Deltaproteobacteria bacterium]
MSPDERFMRQALSLARKGLGSTSPNPVVGALVVKHGRIIGSGYHKRAGAPHAEVVAIAKAGKGARGATLYVTLEPCNHYGRTPPCTRAILESGIRTVVVGIGDPNPHVKGGGAEFLRAQGLEVRCGVMKEECARTNEAYITYVTQGKPFVMVKGALTLDGWIATRTGHSKWITNEKSRRFVHMLRKTSDAIMVGIETVIADDPLLTAYLRKGPAPDPVRVIVDTNLRVPLESRILTGETSTLTCIAAGSKVSADRKKKIEGLGAKVLRCKVKDGRVDLKDLLNQLAKMSICSVLVEGGANIFTTIIRERLVDKYYLFLAPKLLGGDNGVPFTTGPGCDIIKDCWELQVARVRRFDDDIMVEAYPKVGE